MFLHHPVQAADAKLTD
jgi:hypothetical protein